MSTVEDQSADELRKEITAVRSDIEKLRAELQYKEYYLKQLEAQLKSKCKISAASTSSKLTNEEITRYSRQLILPNFGVKAQEKLKHFAVLIVGVGGLGCPAAQYLAAAGVGKIGLVDYDEVERTNLHRQILHTEARLGKPKVESGKAAIAEINPLTKVLTYNELVNSENIIHVITSGDFDCILDCSDNVATRYLLNDACVSLEKPLVYGSALQMDGQLTVYNYGECCPCYRCLFPVPPAPESVTKCGDGGVLGAVTGIIGTLQALEAIKIATGLGEVHAGRLLVFDGTRCIFRSIKVRGRRVDCEVCSVNPMTVMLEDYEQFCGMRASDKDYALNLLQPEERISVQQYKELSELPHLLIDVRSATEFGICRLPESENMPLIEVLNDDYLSRYKEQFNDKEFPIVVLCRRGNDSQIAVQHMRNRFPNHNIRDIAGGLHSWHHQIDSNFPIY